jgi:hypothetical protein
VSRALGRLAAPLVAMGAIGWALLALAQIVKADGAPIATVDSFTSKSEVGAFLAGALAAATAANPKYRSPGSVVSTDESVDDYHDGARTARRTHQAEFAIDEVAISEETADDLAETGDRARGVLFKCVAAPYIEAVWSGERSLSA